MNYNRIMLAGPSGFGKTTLAKWAEDYFDIPFISGSVSDLLPNTKDIPHKDMLGKSFEDNYREDYQILNLRHKLYKDKPRFITDRSYVDLAAYFLYKQSSHQPSCELEAFIDLCKINLVRQGDLIILLNFTPNIVDDWVIEDNNKRITNNYFQLQISSLMYNVLQLMGYKCIRKYNSFTKYSSSILHRYLLPHSIEVINGFEVGEIHSIYGNIDVLIINEPRLDIRHAILKSTLI